MTVTGERCVDPFAGELIVTAGDSAACAWAASVRASAFVNAQEKICASVVEPDAGTVRVNSAVRWVLPELPLGAKLNPFGLALNVIDPCAPLSSPSASVLS